MMSAEQTPTLERGERSSGVRAAAIAALRWPLNLWLESGVWICLSIALAVAYSVSYTSLAAVAGALGYGAWERYVVPLAIDVPLAASVLGQLLAARWQSPWWVKALLLLLSLGTAPLTLAGNALHGAVVGGVLDLSRVDVLHLVAFSIPGTCVVMVAVITSTLLGQRATLAQRATGGGRRSSSQALHKPSGQRSNSRRRARSTDARQSPDGTAVRTALKDLLVEHPDITAAAAAPLIERSPSRTRALLAELRSEGA